jgi:hypothetical protein
MPNTVWCWRFSIIINDSITEEGDESEAQVGSANEPVVEILPIDDYTDAVIDDLNAYYNWLCDEHRWYIADTDLVELERKNVRRPPWVGFVESGFSLRFAKLIESDALICFNSTI